MGVTFGMVGGSYTAHSTAASDEEAINWFVESIATQTAGGPKRVMYGTPGTRQFCDLQTLPARAILEASGRMFGVAGTEAYEINSDGSFQKLFDVDDDHKPASMAASNLEVLFVAAGRAYVYPLAGGAVTEVTGQLVGAPVLAAFSDGYFIVSFRDSDKIQVSEALDGTSWPGLQVFEVSVFPENVASIIVSHRELIVFGERHTQIYQNTGSISIFDPIPGATIEKGCAGAFIPARCDNSVFWIGRDERGECVCWRLAGYVPTRISTFAVETSLAAVGDLSDVRTYAYSDAGHLFWCLYVPSLPWVWVYDVAENLWHKRAYWTGEECEPQHGAAYAYAFGKHLIADWKTAKIFELSMDETTDDGAPIRRLRRTPAVSNQMQRVFHHRLILDFGNTVGPTPPLVDADNAPRAPQAMLRWSDDRGSTWSASYQRDCGMAGNYLTRVMWNRLGSSFGRVYELSVIDPIQWTLAEGYLEIS